VNAEERSTASPDHDECVHCGNDVPRDILAILCGPGKGGSVIYSPNPSPCPRWDCRQKENAAAIERAIERGVITRAR